MKRRGCRCLRMWRAVPCTSRKTLRTESQKHIEVILKTKLGTIQEEPELPQEPPRRRCTIRKGRKLDAARIFKTGRRLVSRFSFGETYAFFLTNFAARGGSFGGLVLR